VNQLATITTGMTGTFRSSSVPDSVPTKMNDAPSGSTSQLADRLEPIVVSHRSSNIISGAPTSMAPSVVTLARQIDPAARKYTADWSGAQT
jgi:hypothetical protein